MRTHLTKKHGWYGLTTIQLKRNRENMEIEDILAWSRHLDSWQRPALIPHICHVLYDIYPRAPNDCCSSIAHFWRRWRLPEEKTSVCRWTIELEKRFTNNRGGDEWHMYAGNIYLDHIQEPDLRSLITPNFTIAMPSNSMSFLSNVKNGSLCVLVEPGCTEETVAAVASSGLSLF